MRWHDVWVDRAPSGAPHLVLEGSSKARMDALGVSEVKVALTHERRMAAAFCVAVGP
jgi:phosphopantetheinyl transferase (holo-ACP synthase)